MKIASIIAVLVIAAEHFYILYLEMFAWETRGKKTFKGALPTELFTPTKVMAANQGLYNGFLAAGLVWSQTILDKAWSYNVAMFFLGCVIVAGVYGGVTASKRIFFVQALPAILATTLVIIADTLG